VTKLVEAVRSLGVPIETSDSGNWVRFVCEEGVPRYIVRDRLGNGYLTWCQDGDHPRVEWYLTPGEAIQRRHQHAIPLPARDDRLVHRDGLIISPLV
jgi:hypothetical protein